MGKYNIPRSIQALEKSPWAEMAKAHLAELVKDTKKQNLLLKQAAALIRMLGKNHPIARRAQMAIDLFVTGRGKDLLTARNLLVLAAALTYFISPADAIPDLIPFFGWMDDVGVLGMALEFVLQSSSKRKEEDQDGVSDEAVDAIAMALPNHWADSKMMQELNALEMEIRNLGNEDLMRDFEKVRNAVADPLRRVVFAGGFSAGKSSLINSLLGAELLPVSPIPCTRALTTIMYGETPKIIVERIDGSLTESDDLSLLKDKDAMAAAKEISVLYPSELLKGGLSIVDTCGLEHEGFDEKAFAELPRASVLVVVKSLRVASINETETKFCCDAADKLTSDQIIVVLNKTDLVDDEACKAAEGEVRKLFADKGMLNLDVYSSCSLPGVGDPGVSQLRAALESRATTSMQSDQAKYAQDMIKSLSNQVNAEKSARAESARLSEKETGKMKK